MNDSSLQKGILAPDIHKEKIRRSLRFLLRQAENIPLFLIGHKELHLRRPGTKKSRRRRISDLIFLKPEQGLTAAIRNIPPDQFLIRRIENGISP